MNLYDTIPLISTFYCKCLLSRLISDYVCDKPLYLHETLFVTLNSSVLSTRGDAIGTNRG